MKTITLEEPGRFTASDMISPGEPGPDEALVSVRRIGICGTDYHAFRGKQPFFKYPRVLGHELGVTVEAVGANTRGLQAGDRCSVEPYLTCGRCIACRRGKPNCCTEMQVLGVHVDGGMREQLLVPAVKLHKSNKLDLDQLALVETLGIGAHGVSRAELSAGENVLVIGAGPIGLSVLPFALQAGANVFLMDISESRLEFAKTNFGVTGVIQGGDGAVDRLTEALGGELPTAVFDATGNPHSMMAAFRFVAHGGKLVFIGLFQGDVTFADPDFHKREMTLLASRNSTSKDFTNIIGLMETGQIDTKSWITHRATFGEMIGGFPTWLDPASGVIKAIVSVE